jgi:hypothetical protein
MTTIPIEEGSCAMSSSGSNSKAHNGEEAEPKRDADEASNEGSSPTMSLTSDEVNYLIFRYGHAVLVCSGLVTSCPKNLLLLLG